MSNENKIPQLRALLVYCCPEDGKFVDPYELELPSVVKLDEAAISVSAQEHGFLRKLARDYRVYCANDEADLLLKIRSYDLFIVFPLSLNTLAKFSLGIQDSFPSRLLAKAAETGKPILLGEGCLPDAKSSMNPHLLKVYKQHWDRLIGGTITGFKQEDISRQITKIVRTRTQRNVSLSLQGSRTFVTKEDIILAAESLDPLVVPQNAIITDAAKEEAEIRGVFITFE